VGQLEYRHHHHRHPLALELDEFPLVEFPLVVALVEMTWVE
jgi:hypothetical protein